MRDRRPEILLLLALPLVSCGEEKTQARVVRFEVNRSIVLGGEVVELTYAVEGARTVSLWQSGDDPVNLLDGQTSSSGTIASRPLDQTTVFTLIAAGDKGASSDQRALQVNVLDAPVIAFFHASSTTVPQGDPVRFSWQVQDFIGSETAIQITVDGEVHLPWTTERARTGTEDIRIDGVGPVEVTLQARNSRVLDKPESWPSESILVTTLEAPVIGSFTLTPEAFVETSTVIRAQWRVIQATEIDLQVEDQSLPGFPTSELLGSTDFEVDSEVTVKLTARNAVKSVSTLKKIRFGFNEPEPNEGPGLALPILADGVPVRGTISSRADEDWYALTVPEGGYVFARVGLNRLGRCRFDTRLTFYDVDGITTLGAVDNTESPPIAPCSEINPLLLSFAGNLPGGTYYLAVGGSGNDPAGSYYLEVLTFTEPPPLPAVIKTTVGTPAWDVVDIVQFAAPGPVHRILNPGGEISRDGSAIVEVLEEILRPFHQFGDFISISALMVPEIPHAIDYAKELGLAAAMHRIDPRQTSFVPGDLEANEQSQRAVYLGFTLVPTVDAEVGPSIDFPAGGPLIPHATFPIEMDASVTHDGIVWAGPFSQSHFLPGPQGWSPSFPGDGWSHAHFFSVIVEHVASSPPTAGSYAWTYRLIDANQEGYELQVPFTVR